MMQCNVIQLKVLQRIPKQGKGIESSRSYSAPDPFWQFTNSQYEKKTLQGVGGQFLL